MWLTDEGLLPGLPHLKNQLARNGDHAFIDLLPYIANIHIMVCGDDSFGNPSVVVEVKDLSVYVGKGWISEGKEVRLSFPRSEWIK